MRHGSLFSGIGGFDLAAEWMGWTNVFNCELDPFPRKVLKYHFPNAIQYEDITKTDFTSHATDIDILSGGFPCQPYSAAGKRLGTEDERHLWPHMLRAIRQIRPTWVVGENVRGFVSWNNGLVFDEVHTELESEGYEVQSFVLPAAGINAPHKRERVWIVAYSEHNRHRNEKSRQLAQTHGLQKEHRPQRSWSWFIERASAFDAGLQQSGRVHFKSNAEDTNSGRLLHREPIQEGAEVWQQRHTSPRGAERIHREKGGHVADTNSRGWHEGNQCQHYGISQWEIRKGESDNRDGVWRFSRSGSSNGSASNTKSHRNSGEGFSKHKGQQSGEGFRTQVWFEPNEHGKIQPSSNTNRDGFDQERRYDSTGKNDDGSNSQIEWSTNSKNFDRCGADGILENKSRVSPRVGKQANAKKNAVTTTGGICGMDQTNVTKAVIGKNNNSTNKGGALVQEGCKRIFSPINTGLEHHKATPAGLATIRPSNDTPRINRVGGHVADTIGTRARVEQSYPIDERWQNTNPPKSTLVRCSNWTFNAEGITKFGQPRDASDTKSIRGRQVSNGRCEDQKWTVLQGEQKGGRVERSAHRYSSFKFASNPDSERLQREGRSTELAGGRLGEHYAQKDKADWQDFPTQSPICGGDDGIPKALDGITFPKWRKESIKAYGNAIVPQIAYRIFRSIQTFNELIAPHAKINEETGEFEVDLPHPYEQRPKPSLEKFFEL